MKKKAKKAVKKASKRMQSGGRIPPVPKGVGDIEHARKMRQKREDEKRGIKRSAPPPHKAAGEQKTSPMGTIQIRNEKGEWVDTGREATQEATGAKGSRGALGAAIREANEKKKKNQMQRGGRVKPKVRKKRR